MMKEVGLGGVQIGAKLKHARKLKRIRLKELSAVVGCSESMLSKIENDKARPSLKMLHSITSALDTTIGRLFAGEGDTEGDVVMRSQDRTSISTLSQGRSEVSGVRMECLIPSPENRLLSATIHVVEPGKGSGGFIQHQGEEIGYILEGELELNVDGKAYNLVPGDSFFFGSNLPHGYSNIGNVTTRILWVNTPPTF